MCSTISLVAKALSFSGFWDGKLVREQREETMNREKAQDQEYQVIGEMKEKIRGTRRNKVP
jgi:hypothetical protein